ncbi:MAG: hypothetical protein MUF52_08335 [Syntrophobacteraceae bacterium]|jgi:hypothetical protein|nr:hypothetical protein [Syntrophobacteraceae bacterium]
MPLLALGAALMLLATGCGTASPPKPASTVPHPAADQPATMGWWYARFRIPWSQGAEPRWHMDVLLATEILTPVIEAHRDDLALWRFHRRAARDAAGHQLSFIFYASPDVAHHIYGLVRSSPLAADLLATGELLEITCDDVGAVRKPNIEDTSDPQWSPLLQRSWPYFIRGVSELWLTLVTQVVESQPTGSAPKDLGAKIDFYRQVNEVVQALWQREGGHALLHHLNAVFQYEPLMVNRREAMQF